MAFGSYRSDVGGFVRLVDWTQLRCCIGYVGCFTVLFHCFQVSMKQMPAPDH